MFLFLAMVIIGGRQSLAGCVTGAIGLTVVQQELINLAAYAQLGYGLVVVTAGVFAPTGLCPRAQARGRTGARFRDLSRPVFPGPPSAPDKRVSPHPALHECPLATLGMGAVLGSFAGRGLFVAEPCVEEPAWRGYARRERDAHDRRRVVIHLTTSAALRDVAPVFAPVIAAWQEIAASYSEGELELIVRFQRRAEEALRQQLTLMRHPHPDS
jgi:hypothetical protein